MVAGPRRRRPAAPRRVARMRRVAARARRPDDVVVDLYLWRRDGPLGDADARRERLRGPASRTPPAAAAAARRRSSGRPRRRRAMGGMQHFTFRPATAAATRRRRFYRGAHPMMGKRLRPVAARQLRPRAAAVGRRTCTSSAAWRSDNPKDERLFAVAEVRDLTPVRDAAGRVVQLPAARADAHRGARPAIRRVQARRPAGQRLHVEPRPPLRLAGARPVPDELARLRGPLRARHRGPRPRGGRPSGPRPGSRRGRAARPVRSSSRSRPAGAIVVRRRSARRRSRSHPLSRVRAEGRPPRASGASSTRTSSSRMLAPPGTTRPAAVPAGRVRRARPRRRGPPGAGRAPVRAEHGQRRRRRHPQLHRDATRRG